MWVCDLVTIELFFFIYLSFAFNCILVDLQLQNELCNLIMLKQKVRRTVSSGNTAFKSVKDTGNQVFLRDLFHFCGCGLR